MANLPTVFSASGLLPQAPADLRAQLVAAVEATNPGFTANLPGSLIEDIVSTDTGSLIIIDSARVETVNSLTPFGANPFLLNQLGQVYGVQLGAADNTSVFVVFSGPPGLVIGAGFLVSDGNFTYVVTDGGIIGTSGQTDQLFAVAQQSGTWAVPAGTVTKMVTAPPPGVALSVVNPEPGTPGADAETETEYRARVLQAGLVASQGMATMLRTLLANVPGVQTRLISAKARQGGGWEIIVGGGDPYKVAFAIAQALFDVSTLVGSQLLISGITAALPGVVTTFLNHGYSPGQLINISDVNPSAYDADGLVVMTVPDEKTFSLGKPYAAQNATGLAWATGVATATFPGAHGVTVGSTFTYAGADPAGFNGTWVAIAGTTTTQLKWAIASDPGSVVAEGALQAGNALYDTSAFGAYVSGGELTPNLRNIEVTITDYPDQYVIPFVNPPQQTVTMTITWNTTAPNFVSQAAVAQAAAPAIATYINTIPVGKPINMLQMDAAFQAAVFDILPPELLSRLVYAVSINGVPTSPDAGTAIIEGDLESFFFTATDGSQVSVVQG